MQYGRLLASVRQQPNGTADFVWKSSCWAKFINPDLVYLGARENRNVLQFRDTASDGLQVDLELEN